MMIVAILVSGDISALSTGALFGCGVVSGFLLALTLSAQRWLWWVVGAILYWLSVDLLYQWLSSWLPLTNWECYVLAMGLCWLPFALWISYRILRYGSVSNIKTVEVKTLNIKIISVKSKDINHSSIADSDMKHRDTKHTHNSYNCIEHSPVYNEDFQPRFR
ncbi:hypothetical protein [Psychrobacter sp. GP33]|uniref:hypothetical protein n=1 Tax=Psychrobacter sp. GP33 TaxID=2758709 RepID=UPI0015FAB75B|nr:hypothetical protein [Psychrobacter sp. GP33]